MGAERMVFGQHFMAWGGHASARRRPSPLAPLPFGMGEGNRCGDVRDPGWDRRERGPRSDPDTLSKVIHSRAERASQAERSEAVNNFAAMKIESNLRPED